MVQTTVYTPVKVRKFNKIMNVMEVWGKTPSGQFYNFLDMLADSHPGEFTGSQLDWRLEQVVNYYNESLRNKEFSAFWLANPGLRDSLRQEYLELDNSLNHISDEFFQNSVKTVEDNFKDVTINTSYERGTAKYFLCNKENNCQEVRISVYPNLEMEIQPTREDNYYLKESPITFDGIGEELKYLDFIKSIISNTIGLQNLKKFSMDIIEKRNSIIKRMDEIENLFNNPTSYVYKTYEEIVR